MEVCDKPKRGNLHRDRPERQRHLQRSYHVWGDLPVFPAQIGGTSSVHIQVHMNYYILTARTTSDAELNQLLFVR